ncbi:uncharacterized protein APUU_50217A [Aspergillus puulaauensis]|uniref:Uncharacterized protein n=1 Tax=Aspergillus puulaauensis TaxID=1220207 RepID=A0A7R7XPU4_9EURO|nr:uncharacterized protein APUU_50217A [Aspergillus puulaauensis]BCS25506.1 hypothetical protein APUU_50217A [Aspergillus puulaauensis]
MTPKNDRNGILFISSTPTALCTVRERFALHAQRVILHCGDFLAFHKIPKAAKKQKVSNTDVTQWRRDQVKTIRRKARKGLNLIRGCLKQCEEILKTPVLLIDVHWITNPAADGWTGHQLHVDDAHRRRLLGKFELNDPGDYLEGHVRDDGSGNNLKFKNGTVIADGLLRTFEIVFVIDDPIEAFPTVYKDVLKKLRSQGGNMANVTSLPEDVMAATGCRLAARFRWIQDLYYWTLNESNLHRAPKPIIADKANLHNLAGGNLKRLCAELGFSEEVVPLKIIKQLEENEASKREAMREVVETLGLQGQDIGLQKCEWERELGQAAANMLEQAITAARPIYHRLRARMLT